MENDFNAADALTLAAEITAAWLSNGNTRVNADDVPAALRSIFEEVSSLAGTGQQREAAPEAALQEFVGATTARKSLASDDHIISMIDGKPYRTLKRHLATNGLTPDQYRARYNLKPEYPMVAPTYSQARRDMAHKIGLGSKGRTARSAASAKPEKAPRKPRAAKADSE